MLYIVATPIGNLADFTLRAQEALRSVDYILCEDTRTSRVLLNHYEISKPLKSFHKFNEAAGESSVIEDLKQGQNVAIISDAGTPGISDPGENLIHACIEAGIAVYPIPGPTALISALIVSGFPTTPFQYLGFLPKKNSEYKAALSSLLEYQGTSIFYESPHRLLDMLNLMPGKRKLSISRELTKKFEETRRGTVAELKDHFTTTEPRGEFVIVVGEGEEKLPEPASLEEECLRLQSENRSRNDIIKTLSQSFRLSKRDILNRLPQLKFT